MSGFNNFSTKREWFHEWFHIGFMVVSCCPPPVSHIAGNLFSCGFVANLQTGTFQRGWFWMACARSNEVVRPYTWWMAKKLPHVLTWTHIVEDGNLHAWLVGCQRYRWKCAFASQFLLGLESNGFSNLIWEATSPNPCQPFRATEGGIFDATVGIIGCIITASLRPRMDPLRILTSKSLTGRLRKKHRSTPLFTVEGRKN